MDYELHEHLLDCTHDRAGTQVAVRLADGCSGRLCQDCYDRLDVAHWPGLSERIGGPAGGLDVLEMLRALRRPR